MLDDIQAEAQQQRKDIQRMMLKEKELQARARVSTTVFRLRRTMTV